MGVNTLISEEIHEKIHKIHFKIRKNCPPTEQVACGSGIQNEKTWSHAGIELVSVETKIITLRTSRPSSLSNTSRGISPGVAFKPNSIQLMVSFSYFLRITLFTDQFMHACYYAHLALQ